MRYELKKIGVWSVVKISFFLNLIVGFVIGIFYAGLIGFIISVGASMPGFYGDELGGGMMATGAMMIFLPIMFALGGAVFNTILALIVVGAYNLMARMMGGLELNFEIPAETREYEPSPGPAAPPDAAARTVVVPPPPPAGSAQPPRVEPQSENDGNDLPDESGENGLRPQ